jgi:rare lipoprotein A (peptidoglycan hydrolase)
MLLGKRPPWHFFLEIDMIRSVVVVALLVVALLYAASSHAFAEQGRASHYGRGDGFHGRQQVASGSMRLP